MSYMANAARELDDETRSQAPSHFAAQADTSSPASKWGSVVQFMRANPKILMQIIPDSIVGSGGSPKSASKPRGGGRVSRL